MIYCLNLVYGILCSYYYDKYCNKKKVGSYIVVAFFISIIWILIVGGQYGIGTDYYSYLDIFSLKSDIEIYKIKNEFLFYWIVSFFYDINLGGQFLFFVFAFINSFLFFIICRKITYNHTWLFLFLYITVSSLFHNQMNGIRQCTATYFVTLAIIYLSEEKKNRFLLFVFVAMGFHASSLIILVAYFLRNITYNYRLAVFLLIVSSLFSLLSFNNIIKSIVPYIYMYSSYADSEYLADISFIGKITKIIVLPFYLYSLNILKRNRLSSISFKLYNIGITAYILKTICLVSSVTSRIGYLSFLISVIPLFFYLEDLMTYNKKKFLFILYCLCVVYVIKVLIIPKGEYTFDSFFLQL